MSQTAQIIQLSSSFEFPVSEDTLVANSVHVDAVHRLLEVQRQKKALEVLEKREKDFLIKEMGKKERLIDEDGIELATYKRDGDCTKWDKEALALLYPGVS